MIHSDNVFHDRKLLCPLHDSCTSPEVPQVLMYNGGRMTMIVGGSKLKSEVCCSFFSPEMGASWDNLMREYFGKTS